MITDQRRAPSPSQCEFQVRGALLAALLLCGCLNPDDIFPVKGTVTSPDGVEGHTVRLLRAVRTEQNPTCDDLKPFKEDTTDEAGAYGFEVFRAQAQTLSGVRGACFRVETSFPSGGAAGCEVDQVDGELRLPPLPDWRAAPRLEDGGLFFTEAAPRPSLGERTEEVAAIHRAQLWTTDGGLAWTMEDVTSFGAVLVAQPLPFDDAIQEDFEGRVVLEAKVTHVDQPVGPFGGNAFTVEARAGDALPVRGTRVPFSRGLECPGFGTPCPFTDGVLTAADGGQRQQLAFSWPTPRSVSRVVIRGVQGGSSSLMLALLGADGGVLSANVVALAGSSPWAPIEFVPNITETFDGGRQPDFAGLKVPPAYVAISVDGGSEVTSVRLGFERGLGSLAEVSLFE